MKHLKFRFAQSADITKLVDLINSAYRQQHGNSWTSEAEIVTGQRINASQLEHALFQDHFQLWIALQDEQIVACIGLTFNLYNVEIGTFCITPHFQNQGIGKQVLDYAEQCVRQSDISKYTKHRRLNNFVMWVLNVRTELIAYYERRGYVQTGVIDNYPLDADVGKPIVDLHLIEMRKAIYE